MRLSYVLLVAAATALLAPAARASASMVTSPEEANSASVARDEVNEKRLLRNHQFDDEDEEERVGEAKIKELLRGSTRDIFSHWKNRGLSPGTVYKKLERSAYDLSDTQISDIVRRYRDVL
ncbi:hypothetical protein PF005_g1723 [Phytophthora fragariae]|uniref:RxLR effector protein n=1 Tax=Phytophthora fragariae TaxID=53985 RepID=A0A6A3U819_9STRA|nr:hypothetical protein PF003_g34201 [Phytophthora fragariae]KAE8947401.1 hypothetical protein PF009_g2989 [Phytophthora fragariae]KAE9004891.1 hypothetical protein PF011_g12264 [Phytophthora fragariae]KAE9127557.1 hypothetical protein PF010_g4855 [Phytophthora fragariae]KAE9137086.1 hypothetical protein PF007_g1937 [Phytophthora fragariae]